jgi:hypothetical protein
MEYGDLQFYRLRSPRPGAVIGRYGVLVLSQYFGDRHLYEFFPKQLKVARLTTLTYQAFIKAVGAHTSKGSTTKGSMLPIDWSAYHEGTNPVEQQQATVIVQRFAQLPIVYGPHPAVPNTFSSPRSLAIAQVIIDNHMLEGIDQIRVAARQPIALADAIRGQDRASAFLRTMMPQPMK